ncbi:MAG: hypothetical protein HY722_08230 [Planctomycetes bacterium]|nr:hypothetical protein [Planctomycetota bacterium]
MDGGAFARLASPRKRERLALLAELELAGCQDLTHEMDRRTKVSIACALLDDFQTCDRHERIHRARFLDAWLVFAPSARLVRSLLATSLEEMDGTVREHLYAAACAAMPSAMLLDELASPPPGAFHRGATLLVLLEAVSVRLRRDAFPEEQMERLTAILRGARAYRASHLGRPFLWRLETVLGAVERRRASLRRAS